MLAKLFTSPAHIFARTLLFIPTLCSRKILEREDISFWQLNRLNPFLYLSQLIKYIFSIPNPAGNSRWLHLLLLLVITVPVLILGLIFIINIPFFIIAEFTLNSLNTLLVEPFLFGYKVIRQSFTDWTFSYFPSDNFLKLNRLLSITHTEDATFEFKIYGAYYLTRELALLVAPEETLICYEKHQNSFFFKTYKHTSLFQKDNQTIVTAYNELENLRVFSYFSRNLLPKELRKSIIEICLQLDLNSTIEVDIITLEMQVPYIKLLQEKIVENRIKLELLKKISRVNKEIIVSLSHQALNPNRLFASNNIQIEFCQDVEDICSQVEDICSQIEDMNVSLEEMEGDVQNFFHAQ